MENEIQKYSEGKARKEKEEEAQSRNPRQRMKMISKSLHRLHVLIL